MPRPTDERDAALINCGFAVAVKPALACVGVARTLVGAAGVATAGAAVPGTTPMELPVVWRTT